MKSTRLEILLGKISVLFLTLTLVSLSAYSQQKGITDGRLINRTHPALAPQGATVDVVGMSGGMSILKSATTDSSGKFRVEGLPTDEPLMIRAVYMGVNYHAKLSFNAAGSAHVEMEVYESTNSMAGIQADGIQMTFQATGSQLASVETISFNNKTNPPRTYVNPEGAFRVSKAAGILDLPQIRVTAPGSSMPLVQPPLESPDGQSYYSQYPLKPGVTTFEIQQITPYENRSYVFKKKFFQDVPSLHIGVIPKDMVLSGQGISRIEVASDSNFSVYASPAIKSGAEIVWTLSGGTIVEQQETAAEEEAAVEARPTAVDQNSLIIGPLLLAGLIAVLWYAFNHAPARSYDPDIREKLLDYIADLDRRYEAHDLNRQEYFKLREKARRRLQSIFIMNRG
jgi:hypothetical protein